MFNLKKIPKNPLERFSKNKNQLSFDIDYTDNEYLVNIKPGTLFIPLVDHSIYSKNGLEIISINFNSKKDIGQHIIMFLELDSLSNFLGLYRDKVYKLFTVDLDYEIIL
jgi:hypothetical protein